MPVWQAVKTITRGGTTYSVGDVIPDVEVAQYGYHLLGLVQSVPPAVTVPLPAVDFATQAELDAHEAAVNPHPGSYTPKRVAFTTSTATLTVNADTTDLAILTAQAAPLTVAAPTGTPSIGQQIVYRFKDDGTTRAITWNAVHRAVGVTLPTGTAAGKTLYVGAMWNAVDSTWDVIAVAQEA